MVLIRPMRKHARGNALMMFHTHFCVSQQADRADPVDKYTQMREGERWRTDMERGERGKRGRENSIE